MAHEDVRTLRNAYEALNRGEIERALDALDPAAEWSEHSDLPEAATYRGRDSIQAFLEGYLESWEDFHQETEDVIDGGDRIAVLLHLSARGRERHRGRGPLRARLDHARWKRNPSRRLCGPRARAQNDQRGAGVGLSLRAQATPRRPTASTLTRKQT